MVILCRKVSIALCCQVLICRSTASAFLLPPGMVLSCCNTAGSNRGDFVLTGPADDTETFRLRQPSTTALCSSNPQQATTSNDNNDATETPTTAEERNVAYINSLTTNLTSLLDRYILTGSPITKQSAYNVLTEIEQHGRDPEAIRTARRHLQRAGLALPALSSRSSSTNNDKWLGKTDDASRQQEVAQRKQWEAQQRGKDAAAQEKEGEAAGGRSALSGRSLTSSKPSSFLMGQVDPNLARERQFAFEKTSLQKEMNSSSNAGNRKDVNNADGEDPYNFLRNERASTKVSELIAKAGRAFDGQTLGIGGLDKVLAQVKRRVWTPLAAPPVLLQELGIAPVRGLLLYGRPGCGKSLLARTLGQMLSPLRCVCACACVCVCVCVCQNNMTFCCGLPRDHNNSTPFPCFHRDFSLNWRVFFWL
jgi:hypothetical protein